MKKVYLIFLLISLEHSFLFAQKTTSGIKSEQYNPLYSQGTKTVCDTLFSFHTIDSWPSGLAFDGSNLYSNGNNNLSINEFSLSGQLLGTFPSPGTSDGDMDFDGTNLWMVSEDDGMIYKIDPTSGNVITSFNLPTGSPSDPDDFGCAYDSGYIWITEYNDETLMRINASTGALVDSFAIHRMVLPLKIINGDLYGIEFTSNSASGPMQLDKFDKTTGAVVESVAWCLPYSLGLCWDGNTMWGLSSGAGFGTQRIYEFKSLLLSNHNFSLLKNNISIFPNPATDNITIIIPDKAIVEILNINGQIIKTINHDNGEISVNIEDLSSGVYIVRALTDKEIVTKKIIKE